MCRRPRPPPGFEPGVGEECTRNPREEEIEGVEGRRFPAGSQANLSALFGYSADAFDRDEYRMSKALKKVLTWLLRAVIEDVLDELQKRTKKRAKR
jgi:hypothetical protein